MLPILICFDAREFEAFPFKQKVKLESHKNDHQRA
jgi:hypothetical protein